MGGTPVLALNIMMFPSSKLSLEAYSAILRGGYDMAASAGVKIIGGHTIDDPVPKFGLAVIGFIHPSKIITNAEAKSGDSLILTKPISANTVLAGHRLKLVTDSDLKNAKDNKKILNESGAGVMNRFDLKVAADITGFGLAGHALKMAEASGASIILNIKEVPLISETYILANEGCIPGALFRNLDYIENKTFFCRTSNIILK